MSPSIPWARSVTSSLMARLLVAFAFACGLNQLFWYYARMKKSECDEKANRDDEYCSKDIHKHFSK